MLGNDMGDFLGGEWSVPITFTPKIGSQVVVSGFTTKHYDTYESDGVSVSGKFSHCSVLEQKLLDLGYTVRNESGKVDLDGHLVTWTDMLGTTKTYIISNTEPDSRIGLIMCMLGDYNGS